MREPCILVTHIRSLGLQIMSIRFAVDLTDEKAEVDVFELAVLLSELDYWSDQAL